MNFPKLFALGAVLLIAQGCQINAKLESNSPAPQVAASVPAETAAKDAFLQVGEMKRGVNVLSEDPGWTDASKARFKPEYFKKIHDAGFSTVRIVLNAFSHMDDYYVLETGYLARLDTMVKAGLDAGLNVILDEHDFNYCSKDTWSCRQKLNAFWAQVAPRYKDASNRLIFEVLNEPHEAFTPEMWNDQIKQTLPIIRASNPTRNVIIGPGFWNSAAYLDKLDLPVPDRHIIVTYHYYAPMEFTHQGSPWVPQYKLTGQNWGSAADLAQLNKDFDVVKAWSNKWNRPILLGEFGAYETAPMDGRLRYTDAVARAAEARGFAWAYWQFDKDFIVYDIAKDQWVEPILNALIPPAAAK
ncbi:endoglucanase [Rhizomicrobium palustre]|uniref:Endoglucanase n=1 Tax=Rhizomicrobium palustre TaxID=189966 RepID=A0A846MY95_9PROT|nr:glycoside hydrolase family 5 protein [Rhizomicrobium palustre]NIK88588.1 endoglucanase [Rhizomicrobium palustre]